MDGELSSLFKANNIHADVTAWMVEPTQAITTLKSFANLLESRTDVQLVILNNIVTQKASVAQRTNLKQAWREADAIYTHRLKRTSEGLSAEIPDEALPDATQTNVLLSFQAHYKGLSDIPNDEMGSDILLAKFFREFELRRPQMMSVSNMKTVASAHLSTSTKKSRVGHIELTTSEASGSAGPQVESCFSSGSLDYYLSLFLVMINTWAVAGCVDVVHDGNTRKYVEWQEVKTYHSEFKKKAWRLAKTFTKDSVVAYITRVEECIRADAIGYARHNSSPLPWGLALLAAIKGDDHWKREDDILRRFAKWQKTSARPNPRTRGKDTGKGGGKDTGKGGGKHTGKQQQTQPTKTTLAIPGAIPGWRRFQKAKNDHFGKPLCDKFNTNMGCKNPCKNRERHACNVILKSGQSCEGPHARCNHNPSRDGEPRK